jgi:hypothetical protein
MSETCRVSFQRINLALVTATNERGLEVNADKTK